MKCKLKLLLSVSILFVCQLTKTYAETQDKLPQTFCESSQKYKEESAGFLGKGGELLFDQIDAMQAMEKYYSYHLDPGYKLTQDWQTWCTWREKMGQWNYNVADHFHFNREIVSHSMKLVDRYIEAKGLGSHEDFQLLSMTALYLVIKVSQKSAVAPKTFAELSRGLFQPEDIENMERKLLDELKYKINPPLEMHYLKKLKLLLFNIEKDVKQEIFEKVRFLIEYSITDSYFIGKKNIVCGFFSFNCYGRP